MRIVGYTRVSTEEQAREGISLEAQKSKIAAWAEALGHEILAMEEDAGVSGKDMNRDGLQRAIERCCEQQAALVVYSISRLSRSTRDTLMAAERLDKHGANLISLTERIDSTSASGKMIFRLMAVLNEFERDQVSERTQAILRHKKEKGEVYASIPFGFDRQGDRLVENEEEMRTVDLIRKLRAEGYSLRAVAEELNDRQLPTKNCRKWYASTVRYILRNDVYQTL